MRAAVRGPLPPALVAYARDDHMIETEVAEDLAAAIPGARVLAFDDGGHNIQKTRAVELGAAIRALTA
jgi:pimeloyl-ACP methyl ester carboxylesterase